MMGQRRVLIAISFVLFSLGVAAGRVRALHDPAAAQAGGTTPRIGSPPIVPSDAHPGAEDADLQDSAFNRLMNARLLARAWERQDAALLMDMALLLAEGERILMRPHHAFRSNDLLELAVYVAADLDDHVTLKRLAKAAELRRDAALAALVKQADQLMATPSADRHDWASDIESISRHSLSVHQATLRHIRVIRICGDRESLDELKKAIQALPDLTLAQREHAVKAIEDHTKNLKQCNPALRTTISKLVRLTQIYPSPRSAAGPEAGGGIRPVVDSSGNPTTAPSTPKPLTSS
jgi:hypothetical protein